MLGILNNGFTAFQCRFEFKALANILASLKALELYVLLRFFWVWPSHGGSKQDRNLNDEVKRACMTTKLLSLFQIAVYLRK